MTKLAPIELEDGTVIYIEATEDMDTLSVTAKESSEDEETEESLGEKGMSDDLQKQAIQSFQKIQTTIHAYTVYTLSAFKKVAIANVDKVTLEFGIELGGEAGVPYVTKGTAKSNLKITVECSFPDKTETE
ncbi:MAG: hypothetical protein ICV63_14280 [Coleofasciculus sp. Co-bin14]|nr:hypothetical protein [Coleofasciculus sp. Co-bin14]